MNCITVSWRVRRPYEPVKYFGEDRRRKVPEAVKHLVLDQKSKHLLLFVGRLASIKSVADDPKGFYTDMISVTNTKFISSLSDNPNTNQKLYGRTL